MKILFVFALLTNIIIFLWEYNKGTDFIPVNLELTSNKPKQILLLAEFEAKKNNTSIDISVGRAYAFSEFVFVTEANLMPVVTSISDHLLNKASSQQIEKILKVSLKKVEDVQKQVRRNKKAPISLKKTRDAKQQSIDFQAGKNNQRDIKNSKIFCYQVGPFDSSRNLRKWSRRNKINKNSLHQQRIDKPLNTRYLVYYPAAKTFSQSKQNVRMLKKKGVSEYWLIRKGSSKGVISLGFFSQEQSAQGLQKKLLQKGLKVNIKQRVNKKPVFFAQVSSNDKKLKDRLRIKKNQTISACNDD